MTASTFTGTLRGPADDRLADVVERMEGFIAADPDLSLQAGALVPARRRRPARRRPRAISAASSPDPVRPEGPHDHAAQPLITGFHPDPLVIRVGYEWFLATSGTQFVMLDTV